MQVKECVITDLLTRKRIFIVPPFQRRYAWKEQNFKMLWDDILAVADGDRKRHFMGTVIFEKTGREASSLVIDGQQRLTTYMVILKVMHALSAEFEKDRTRAKKLHSLLWLNRDSRFKPSLPDRPAFDTLMDNPAMLGRERAHKYIKACYVFFNQEIRTYIETTKGTKYSNFSRLYSCVLEQMIFVELQLAANDDAHSIFETINYAGVPLTSADLARNFVLGLAKRGESPEQLNQKYWQPLEHRLEQNVFGSNRRARKVELQRVLPEFIRAFLVVEKKKYISSSDAFREFRAFFRGGDVEGKLADLCTCSETFCKFLNPELEKSKSIRLHLQNFMDLRMTTQYPVVILLYRAYEKKQLTAAALKKCLQYIESFVIRRAFKSKVSRDLNKVFARVAGKLADIPQRGRAYVAVFANLLSAEGWPNDDDFKASFVSSPIYTTAPAFARFSLVAIEKKRSEAHREMSFASSIQIEHVFPQQEKTGDWNADDLPALKKNLHVMGNLTLTGHNPKLSNHGFVQKVNGPQGYKKSPYWLTRQTIANQKQWTAKEIEMRSGRLLKDALLLWPAAS